MANVKTWHSDELDIDIMIDYDKCEGHAECVDVCPEDIYELVEGKAVPKNIDDCTECCKCVDACPTEAIEHSSC
ncbi:MAG: ferredoxin family protein [Candidatus Wukongarchaeota archaeon]|jgi:NAD-dependent dihydropyrimidine dehydrogenase PreA subunit|nr:4Fe-4S dicluster domain-containing protein [Candidatus Wukongarchaeota archaeon]